MGVIGPGLFDDDTAADVRGIYRDYIEQGVDDQEALRRILQRYDRWFGRQQGVGALVGFAVTQYELGRLDPAVRDRAIAAIDRGGDLALRPPASVERRRAVLAESRALLSAPQPPRAQLEPPKIEVSNLDAGDILALKVPSGFAIFRVVSMMRRVRKQQVSVLEQLEYRGSDVPTIDLLKRSPRRDLPKASRRVLFVDQILVIDNPGEWQQLGFRRIGRMQGRKAKTAQPVVHRQRRVTWSQLSASHQNSPPSNWR